jgi:hypothetical protein
MLVQFENSYLTTSISIDGLDESCYLCSFGALTGGTVEEHGFHTWILKKHSLLKYMKITQRLY